MDPWAILEAAGVPSGTLRHRPKRKIDRQLRVALRKAQSRLDRAPLARREALFAWLCALRSGWPGAYREILGGAAGALWRKGHRLDPGRHIKLRRIARENLSRVL